MIRSLLLSLVLVLAGGTLATAGDTPPATPQAGSAKAQEWLLKHEHKHKHHHRHHKCHHHKKGESVTTPPKSTVTAK